jgi:hypothetical protein
MPDDNVVDMQSRKRRKDDPRVWEMVEQSIGLEGITEVVAILADVSADSPTVQLFQTIPNEPDIRERVYTILREATIQLQQLEDSITSEI